MIFFICAIISALQVSLSNQQLSFAAYNCGRAAAVSETESIGKERAIELYESIMNDAMEGEGYVKCEIEVLNGAPWQKGEYIKCTVRCYVDVLMPFTSGVKEHSIIMMIEGGDI